MPKTSLRISFAITSLILALFSLPNHAQAQYFGQNKVQYEGFKFQVLKTPHFDIYYYPSEADAAQQAGRMAERWHERLSRIFSHELSSQQPVILYASHPDFAETNVVEGDVGEGTGGVTENARRRVTLPFGASLQETDHVLGHELVHAYQYDILGPSVEGLPLWFIEGMAEYLSLGSRDVQTAMWLRDAAIENRLPTIDRLNDPRYFPYRFGHAFWAYIGGRWGDQMIGRIVGAIARNGAQGLSSIDPVAVIESATKRDRKQLSAEWQAAVLDTYPVASETPAGTLIGEHSKDGSITVGPSLSPDGSKIAFLSSRDRLSIDLFLADASTGKVIRKLISTATDPHFESLQFLASAGSWDPTGNLLAIASIRGGRPVLAIVDTNKGDVTQEIKFETYGEIFQPAWSADGKAIAFSGQVGGYTDLYVRNLSTGETKRLTNDAYADLQPSWSPDGTQLMFVTDRFLTKQETLAFAGYGLAVMDVASGAISPVETGLKGNAINPQWSRDGKTIYFINDQGGRQNAYRMELASHQATKLTDETTGVAGITPLSPALSIAQNGQRAGVSIFHDSGYEIHVIDITDPPTFPADARNRDDGLLPPATRSAETSTVNEMLQHPAVGLPPATQTYPTEKYKPKFGLVNIGQSIGLSTGGFGTYATGGISMTFSDMLGNHLLGTSVFMNGGVKDVGGEVSYLNRTSRWNWGVYGQQLPISTGSISTGFIQQGGQTVFAQQTEIIRQTYTEAGAFTAYPLSRASRVEFGAAVTRIGFAHELRTQTADPNTGQELSDNTITLPGEATIFMQQVSAAVVRDTAIMGATSPLVGQRVRLEVAPSFGDLRMTTLTADLRQYFMPVKPITFAGRLLHIGRYGGSSDDERLAPLDLGYPTLVRGYDIYSFGPGDCTPNAVSGCPEYDRLIGSRILVLNGEVRAPVAGLFNRKIDYGPVPVEVLGFVDSGVAWTQLDRPTFANGTRQWVTSVGAGARVNVLGFLIAEFDLARALQRPQQGWMFLFNLRPGF
jgi:hypothetical protein